MKSLSVHYSPAIEACCALFRYGTFEDYRKITGKLDIAPPVKEITQWKEQIEERIPPLLSSDIDQIIRHGWFNIFSAISLAVKENISLPAELIQRVNALSEKEYIRSAFESFDFKKNSISLDSPPALLKQKIELIRDKQEADHFISLLEHPSMHKKRFSETLELFYQLFLKNTEDTLHKVLSREAEQHTRLLVQDEKIFFRNFFRSDYSSVLNTGTDIAIYISEFLEYDFLYFEGVHPVIVYGRYNSLIQKRQTKKTGALKILKALSDEKRIAIIKLLKNRTWYSNELAEHFALTPATMSYHINRLTSIGLVEYETGDQNRLYYRINKNRLKHCLENAYTELTGDTGEEY